MEGYRQSQLTWLKREPVIVITEYLQHISKKSTFDILNMAIFFTYFPG